MNELRPIPDDIIARLLPEELPTVEQIEAQYPPRELPEGAKVTRVSPSPTGYLHIGTVSTALRNERPAHQSGGVFYLRIEDTDEAREVEGTAELIAKLLPQFDIKIDEGPTPDGGEIGAYGPYTQSKREKIYKAYIKKLLAEGWAYPCFKTPAELEEMRDAQMASNIRPGYYGKYALSRDLTDDEIRANLDAGKPFVIRYRANGSYDRKMKIVDLIKGEHYLPENDIDDVILKSISPLPTYHFAHVIDDHLMGTTHALRGEEWFPSTPKHIQMFAMMGWKAPKYGHLAPLDKLDNGSRRKISKRKDPEADSALFLQQGYPVVGVIEYLMNLANSNFEDWRKANPTTSVWDFPFSFNKLNESGALFDFVKLDSVCRDCVGRMSADEIYDAALEWAGTYNVGLAELLKSDPDYCKAILNIERAGSAKVRKDIVRWSDVESEVEYFFDDKFSLSREDALKLLEPISAEDIRAIVEDFKKTYDPADDKNAWFGKVKAIAEAHGFTSDMKAYRADPAKFKGSVSDVAKIFRVLLKGTVQSPDLCSIMQVMGRERVFVRLGLV